MIYIEAGEFEAIRTRQALSEKSNYSGAINLSQAKSLYNRFLKAMEKGKADKSELDEKIKILETTKKNMQEELRYVQGGNASPDRIKYSLKALIPLNSVARLIKNHDVVPILSDVFGLLVGVVTKLPIDVAAMGLRYTSYEHFLEQQIERTDASIKYLKKQRSGLK